MARVSYNQSAMLADWKTGEYTERELAYRHGVSPGTAHKVVKGTAKTLAPLISKQVEIKRELATLNKHEISSFEQVVDEHTKHIQFFTDVTVLNIETMAKKITEKTSIPEHKLAQEAIARGKETVFGKQPETAIQINNQSSLPASVEDFV